MTRFQKGLFGYSASNFRSAVKGSLVKPWYFLFPTAILAAVATIAALMPVVGLAAGVKLGVLMLLPDGTIYSGRSKGNVFQKNGIRRNFRSPSNPRSSAQMTQRNLIGGFSSLWRSLTSPQQATWLNLVFKRVNRVGGSSTIKGKSAYVELNTNLALIGVPAITSAPALAGVSGAILGTSVIDATAHTIDPDLTNGSASYGVIIYASFPLASGRYTGRTKQIFSKGTTSILGPADFTAAWNGYIAAWGYTPQAADRIILECRYVNKTTGEGGTRGHAIINAV